MTQTQSMQKPRSSLRAYYPVLILLSSMLGACSSFSPSGNTLNTGTANGPLVQSSLGSFGELDRKNNVTRNSAAVEDTLGFVGRNFLLDPIIRPFSTVKALFGLTFKSAGGLIERAFIENLRFPKLELKPIPPISDTEPMDLVAWEKDLDDLTHTKSSSGTIRFLVDGDEYFPRISDAIINAEDSIGIRTYIFDNDDVALEIANLLRAKADEVDVKILVDGLANVFAVQFDSSSMPDDIELPSSMSDYLTYGTKVAFRERSNPWFTGDHAKVTIIDKERAFLGGMNIGREYRYDWHDLMMEVEGPIVKELQFDFELAWEHSGMGGDFAWFLRALKGHDKDTSGTGYPIRMITTSIHDSKLYRAQVAAIRRAQSYIYIENAYFSDDKILFELARARRRGVDVRVIMASSNDSNILELSNQKAINTMLRNGIRVYAYPGMTHVKAAVYDGWICLGSANFDKLSLQINREINLATSHEPTVQRLLARVFWPDIIKSTELYEPIELDARHHLAEFFADELF